MENVTNKARGIKLESPTESAARLSFKWLVTVLVWGSATLCLSNGTSVAQLTCSSVTSLSCGETKSGQIGAAEETDCFEFSGQAGEVASIITASTTNSPDFLPCWALFAPNNSGVGLTSCGQAQPQLPLTGIYTIKVFDSSQSATGSYHISREIVSGTSGNCGEPLACGQTLERAINIVGEADTFIFTAAAGETVSINIASTTNSEEFLPCWALFAPDGAQLGLGSCGQGQVSLPASGMYSILVVDQDHNATGSYHISREIVSGTSGNCGEPLACGQELERTIGAVGEMDTFTFSVAEAGVVSITTAKTSGGANFEPCWSLFAFNGETVIGGGACGSSSATLPSPGTYNILVVDYGSDDTGSYNISLGGKCQPPLTCPDLLCSDGLFCNGEETCQNETCMPGTPPCSDDGLFCNGTESCNETTDSCQSSGNPCPTGLLCMESTDACEAPPSTATLVCHDTPKSGELSTPTETDVFYFNGVVGQLVNIVAEKTAGTVDPCWRLIDPNGLVLTEEVCHRQEAHELTVAGLYTVEVFDHSGNETGPYTISLDCQLPDECSSVDTLACGQSKVGTISRIIERDCFEFNGTSGQEVTIDTQNADSFDACWQLRDPTGATLTGKVCEDQQTVSLSTPGTHRIEITDLGNNETGSYLVSMCCGAASEACNGVDDNCNGQTDEGVQSTFYRDNDGDSYGDPSVSTQACSAPTGYVTNSTDCNDTAPGIHPGVTETCGDGIDQDCNGADLACPPPSLTVRTPNGGETWPIGSTQPIQWNPAGVKGKVKIELSRNGGETREVLFGSTANDGTQNWKVTGPTTSKALVRISSIVTPSIVDISNAMFTIGGGSVTVIAPNGGETWPIGSTQTIRWSSTGLSGKVKIEISRDGGTNWTLLSKNVINTGSKTWKVTKPATTRARIRVSSMSDPSVVDTSDGIFTVK